MIEGLDHAVVAVADLPSAHARFARLGFTLTPRRRFADWGNANHAIMFPHDFIELLGVIDASRFTTPGLVEFLARGEGIMAITLAARDIASVHRWLMTRDMAPTAVAEVTINLEAPTGPVPQGFRWLRIGAAATPDLYLMVVQPRHPETMRSPATLAHANGARGIRSMTVIVRDVARVRAAYQRLFNARDRVGAPDHAAIATGHGTIHFVTEAGFARLHGGAVHPAIHPVPTIAAITLDGAPEVAAGVLRASAVPHTLRDGTLRVPPEATAGFWLEFRDQESENR